MLLGLDYLLARTGPSESVLGRLSPTEIEAKGGEVYSRSVQLGGNLMKMKRKRPGKGRLYRVFSAVLPSYCRVAEIRGIILRRASLAAT